VVKKNYDSTSTTSRFEAVRLPIDAILLPFDYDSTYRSKIEDVTTA